MALATLEAAAPIVELELVNSVGALLAESRISPRFLLPDGRSSG